MVSSSGPFAPAHGVTGMGYVGCEAGVTKDWLSSGTWEVEVACQRYRARVQLEPLYDPKNERIKA